jgi:ADP-heptose:LPS heptosyltransferase
MTSDRPAIAARHGRPRIGLLSSVTDLGVMVVRSLLIKLLRERHPQAHIAVLAEETALATVRAFYEQASWADECVAIPCARPQGDEQVARVFEWLRAQCFDVLILNPRSAFPAALARDAGIPVAVGLDRDGVGAAQWTHPVLLDQAPQRDLHWTVVLAAYARALGLDYRGAAAHVPFLRVHGTWTHQGPRPHVVMHVGGNPEWNRRWPRRRFERLCRRLVEEGAAVTLIGGRHEALDNAAIVEALRGGGGWLGDASERPLADVARLLLDADLFVGNDSGPMNVAVALGVPVVAVRGADPENFRADVVDARHVVLSNWQACSRRETGNETCLLDCPVAYDQERQTYPRCLEAIPFDSVWSAVRTSLQRARPAATTTRPEGPLMVDRRTTT